MTNKVTKESLAENIGRLESYGDLSLNEEYQLKAYRLLAIYMESCAHSWVKDKGGVFHCEKCAASWGDEITQQRENDLLLKAWFGHD